MSSALKCDRCGKLYEDYPGVSLSIIDGGHKYNAIKLYGSTIKDMDMCPDCMKGLIFFMNNIEEAKNE